MSAILFILMGSDSDLPQMQPAIDTLAKFDIRTEVKVTGPPTPQATHSVSLLLSSVAVPFLLQVPKWPPT